MEKLVIFPLFIFLLALHFLSLQPFSSAYTLPQEYFINCGSNSNFKDNESRNFVGDRHSDPSFSVGKSSHVEDRSSPASVSRLYQSARIYRRSSYYEFKINERGTYFVRLHFFAFSTSDNLSNAIFSVSVPGFMLLSNFSVKNSPPDSPVIKEFLVNVNVGRFIINFMPSDESNLAFVNAIEFYIAPESFINDTAPIITPAAGGQNSFNGLRSQALHPVYRINVGGSNITPDSDPLWRDWISDDRFLLNPKTARNSGYFFGALKYLEGGGRGADEYSAPSPVYRTAKQLNREDSGQSNFFNITWSFNVSKSSRHFVRVHFCDIIATSPADIIFNLYIYNNYNQTIYPYVQVRQLEAPYYFDFVVDSDESGIMNISIGPRSDSPEITAFLNGLEIMEFMKKSDTVLPQEKLEGKRSDLFPIVGSVVGGAFAIILMVTVLVCLKCRKTKPAKSSSWPLSLPLFGRDSSYKRKMSEETANMSPSNLNLALRIPYHEIEQSTKNFDSNLLIGVIDYMY